MLGGPTTGLDMAFSAGLAVINSLLSVMLFPIALAMFGLVLYYFSGNKKHAEEFMPRLMKVGTRINNCAWLLIGSISAFVGLQMVLSYLFEVILPDENAYLEIESETFVRGLVYLLIGLMIMAFHYYYNTIIKAEDVKEGTVANKVFINLGVVIFSVLSFISIFIVAGNILDNMYEKADFLSADSLAVLFSSLIFWGMYIMKSYKMVKKEESKK
ncbi:MAG: DUF5671 domain-containing protein [Candidatus Dojkabacteria bacterium]|nr:DUF5671 domain-containing protein [Candidatus Dojkabacteria bacterium]MDQ7021680.1 DUF5671 domain-containing protein [Candidatus Dojkabacteria bacterium]